ncbi:hypothetical protein BGZ73_007470 [Actinomortierella ambigua]|nr:hypothetical protein BGZ73_007470 [Actinomortierella ambigua]
MAKHVYPPWHKSTQRVLFGVAAILLITFPTLYGRRLISGKVLTSVLGVFFGFWLAFSLAARYLLPSYTRESTLPIHTHAPLPPIILHSPKPDAVPAAPAIRIHSAYDPPPTTAVVAPDGSPVSPPPRVHRKNQHGRARFGGDDDGDKDDDNDRGVDGDVSEKTKHGTARREGSEDRGSKPGTGSSLTPPPASASSPPQGHGNNVKFQTRPRAYTGDSTHSEVYPTFATYRQQQHPTFDAFAQRIRRAFIAATTAAEANSANRSTPGQDGGDSSGGGDAGTSQDQEARQEEGGGGGKDVSDNYNNKASGSGGLLTVESAIDHPTHSTPKPHSGRPRSTSAASMISNLSERMKLANLFGRTSSSSSVTPSSRRGSDASLLPPPAPPPPAAAGTGPSLMIVPPEGTPAAEEGSRSATALDALETKEKTTGADAGTAIATPTPPLTATTPATTTPLSSPTSPSSSPTSLVPPESRRLSLTAAPREPSPLALAGNVMTHGRWASATSASASTDEEGTGEGRGNEPEEGQEGHERLQEGGDVHVEEKGGIIQ